MVRWSAFTEKAQPRERPSRRSAADGRDIARYNRRMKIRWQSLFRREKKNAERLVENPVAVLRAAEHASLRAQQARGPLGRIWNDLQTALRLARAWGRRAVTITLR